METYSGINEEKQTIATITIEQSISSFRYYGSNRPDNFYEQARLIAEKNEKVASIIPLFKTDNQKCTSEIAYSLESDTKTANRTMGMTIATGTCTRSNEIYIVKRRTAIGENDGIYRHITVGARKDTWSKNEKLFQTILDSIGEVKEN